ncbi:MAG: NAD(P)/FAD-dependent oxidoreductase [Streptosporangiales bacterium]
MTDLLVVGGGPAGLGTAIHAVMAGLDVMVAEQRPAPIDKACGEGLMPGAVRALSSLGVRVAGYPFRGIRYLDDRQVAQAAFRDGSGLGVRRTELHAALAHRAAELGIPVLPARVTEFHQDDGGVTVAGRRARYLVAADGLHSRVRRAVGLDLADRRVPRYGLRRHFHVAPWSEYVEVHWTPRAEAYVTPIGPELVGVAVLTAHRGPFTDHLATFPRLAARLRDAPAGPVLGAGPLRQRVRHRVAGRVLLVGDAAGYVDALTGEGIAVALTAARQLVQCVLDGRIDRYDRAWRRGSRTYRLLTESLLWARNNSVLAPRIVPTAARLPGAFRTVVGLLG